MILATTTGDARSQNVGTGGKSQSCMVSRVVKLADAHRAAECARYETGTLSLAFLRLASGAWALASSGPSTQTCDACGMDRGL